MVWNYWMEFQNLMELTGQPIPLQMVLQIIMFMQLQLMLRVINGLELIGGVSKFDGTNWTTYTTTDGLAFNFVNAIAIDAQGNKWFGT